jgi:hypothetical protein
MRVNTFLYVLVLGLLFNCSNETQDKVQEGTEFANKLNLDPKEKPDLTTTPSDNLYLTGFDIKAAEYKPVAFDRYIEYSFYLKDGSCFNKNNSCMLLRTNYFDQTIPVMRGLAKIKYRICQRNTSTCSEQISVPYSLTTKDFDQDKTNIFFDEIEVNNLIQGKIDIIHKNWKTTIKPQLIKLQRDSQPILNEIINDPNNYIGLDGEKPEQIDMAQLSFDEFMQTQMKQDSSEAIFKQALKGQSIDEMMSFLKLPPGLTSSGTKKEFQLANACESTKYPDACKVGLLSAAAVAAAGTIYINYKIGFDKNYKGAGGAKKFRQDLKNNNKQFVVFTLIRLMSAGALVSLGLKGIAYSLVWMSNKFSAGTSHTEQWLKREVSIFSTNRVKAQRFSSNMGAAGKKQKGIGTLMAGLSLLFILSGGLELGGICDKDDQEGWLCNPAIWASAGAVVGLGKMMHNHLHIEDHMKPLLTEIKATFLKDTMNSEGRKEVRAAEEGYWKATAAVQEKKAQQAFFQDVYKVDADGKKVIMTYAEKLEQLKSRYLDDASDKIHTAKRKGLEVDQEQKAYNKKFAAYTKAKEKIEALDLGPKNDVELQGNKLKDKIAKAKAETKENWIKKLDGEIADLKAKEETALKKLNDQIKQAENKLKQDNPKAFRLYVEGVAGIREDVVGSMDPRQVFVLDVDGKTVTKAVKSKVRGHNLRDSVTKLPVYDFLAAKERKKMSPEQSKKAKKARKIAKEWINSTNQVGEGKLADQRQKNIFIGLIYKKLETETDLDLNKLFDDAGEELNSLIKNEKEGESAKELGRKKRFLELEIEGLKALPEQDQSLLKSKRAELVKIIDAEKRNLGALVIIPNNSTPVTLEAHPKAPPTMPTVPAKTKMATAAVPMKVPLSLTTPTDELFPPRIKGLDAPLTWIAVYQMKQEILRQGAFVSNKEGLRDFCILSPQLQDKDICQNIATE